MKRIIGRLLLLGFFIDIKCVLYFARISYIFTHRTYAYAHIKNAPSSFLSYALRLTNFITFFSHRPKLRKIFLVDHIETTDRYFLFLFETIKERRLFILYVYIHEIWIWAKTDVVSVYRASFMDRKIREPSSISKDSYVCIADRPFF